MQPTPPAAPALASPDQPTLPRADIPDLGTRTPHGIFAGLVLTEEGHTAALFLLVDTFTGKWQAALDWAAALSEDAHVPSREESGILFANVKMHIEPKWHWTSAQDSANYAWIQSFYGGNHDYAHKGHEYRARAVRSLVIQ